VNPIALRTAAALLATAALTPAALAADPSLTAGEWSIVEMDGKRVPTPATMNFTRVRWLGLQTPCGPLSGWYRHSGTTLNIHIAGRARHEIGYRSSCQGIDYQLLLGRVRTYKADGDSLVLLGQGDKPVARLIKKK
jgi:hypothetical protein